MATCARLTECRVNGDNVNYIASSCDNDKKFIYYAPLNTLDDDLPCKLNYLLEVDYNPMPNHGCIRSCIRECARECDEEYVKMEHYEKCIKDCELQCNQGCTEEYGDEYPIAQSMKLATDSQCPECSGFI